MSASRTGFRLVTAGLLALFSWSGAVGAPSQSEDSQSEVLAFLYRMVDENPERADSWRLIGRIHRTQGDVAKAKTAFERALSLQPDNIAAHADLGDLLTAAGDVAAADAHYDRVMSLGPQSSYAQGLIDRGLRTAPAADVTTPAFPGFLTDASFRESDHSNQVDPAGYEIQTFDGADDLQQRLNALNADRLFRNNIRAFVELGAMYNSNLSLTPISRELRQSRSEGAQMFAAPSIEWIALDKGNWRLGPLARGYFSVNEGNFRSLNLTSLQPGIFIERDFQIADRGVIGRLEYVYSIDFLGETRFGDRHSLTASLTTILPDNDIVHGYLTTALSNFKDDGTNAAVESLDGTSVAAGISRVFHTGNTLVPAWSLGADTEFANTTGDDFRYNAITFFGDATIQLNESLALIPRAGIGYRDYYDFTGPVNRDELTGRLAARLQWQCSEQWSVSVILGYDRFASENRQFDTDRTEAGIVFTFLH